MHKGIVFAAGAAVVAACLVTVALRRGDGAESVSPVPPSVAAAPAPPAAAAPITVVPITVVPVAAARDPQARDRQLELPDGTFVPTLNGATGALSLGKCWGARPWSPIERIERSDLGIDWYVHADGTRTTTEMKWRDDLRRLDAMTRIAVPQGEPPPLEPRR